MERKPKYGQHVVYVDSTANVYDAVVTNVFGESCINLVFVTKDGDKKDTYGRQLERETSLLHMRMNPTHGKYWRFADEQGKPTERSE